MSTNGDRVTLTERLRELISGKFKETGRSHRWAERKLKLRHGIISNVLAGRAVFRLEHLDLFAELFRTTPSALVAEAEGTSTQIGTQVDPLKLHLILQHLIAAMQAAEDAVSHEKKVS